ncbi:flagellar hook capping FlgD N-terminal domain-containing protein [Rubrivivax gelatinosus]|uniref:Basal-body rod modification protein FlgD n=1 Tax=Rubrivivax gelatinosus (strain NBRC 100245 / IL144) TaxID=983917 RepID=I0HQN5_RUBGI|nr:flagellar hook capping FlgD N-terminal domain-containing protein [Rubrivivax gelatinosus]BAL95322.1 putative basal-body rod modification protein LfgD [Rubrivivax gelatinosus IL144]
MAGLYTDAAATATKAGSGSTVAANGSTSDMFTSLLVAQIRNQNPLEPTDASQFVTQLTQLSQMESLQTLATQGSATAGLITGLQALGFGGMVGHELGVTTDKLVLDGQHGVAGRFELAEPSSTTKLQLTSASGKTYTVDLGSQPAGEVAFELDPAKTGVPAGSYTIAVATSGGEKPAIEVTGKLNSVRLSAAGTLVLDVQGVGQTDPDAVTTFSGRSAATAI